MADIRTISVTIDANGAKQNAKDLSDDVKKVTKEAQDAEGAISKMNDAFEMIKGAVIAAGIFEVAAAVTDLVNKLGDFNDFADKMGTSGEAVMALNEAVVKAGTSLDSMAGWSAKLTNSLSKVDDESAGVGEALGAIGLRLDDIKGMKPEERFKAIADALSGFQDGSEKSAIAMQIFGKSGAEAIPFLKELAEIKELDSALSQEQIDKADDLSKANDVLNSKLTALGQVTSLSVMPAVNGLKQAFYETMGQMLGLDSKSKEIKEGKVIQTFAYGAGLALSYVADIAQTVVGVVQSIGTSLGAVGAIVAAALSGNWEGMKEINRQADADLAAIWNKPSFSENYKKAMAEMRDATKEVATAAGKPTITVPNAGANAAAKAAAKEAATAAKEAQRELEKQIRLLDQITDKIDPAVKKEREFAQQQAFLASALTFTDSKLKQLGTTREQVRVLIDKSKKAHEEAINVYGAEYEKLQTQIEVLGYSKEVRESEAAAIDLVNRLKKQGIQVTDEEIANYKKAMLTITQMKNSESFEEGMKSRVQALADETALVGLNTKEREKASALMQIQREAEKLGIKDSSKAIADYTKAYETLQARIKSTNTVAKGAGDAFYEYTTKIKDIAATTRDGVTNIFSSLDQTFTDFFMSWKLDLNNLQKAIGQLLAQLASRALQSALIDIGTSLFGGYRANGGGVDVGKSYIVGEKGPELFTPSTTGAIIPNSVLASATTSMSSTSQSISLGGVHVTVANYGGQVDEVALGNKIGTAVIKKLIENKIVSR